MNLKSLFASALFVPVLMVVAAAQPAVIPLWEKGPPGHEDLRNLPEEAKDYWVRSIHNPSLTVFQPEPGRANGCSVIVAPGGGLRELVYHAEGEQAAEMLNKLGVTVFVLKYRLPRQEGSPYDADDVRRDALRAVQRVRALAPHMGLDPQRIGFLGFSAGGGVALYAGFGQPPVTGSSGDAIDRLSGRPDFLMLVYPAPLLFPGDKLPADLATPMPPAFLVAAGDDEWGCDTVAIELLEKYRAAHQPVELHLLARGKHAFNMGERSKFLAVRHWPDRMADWLADSGYLKPRPEGRD